MSKPKLGQQATGTMREGHDSPYLAADDIPTGTDVTVTIINCTWEEVTSPHNTKSNMWCLWFKGAEKKLALNETNKKTIKAKFDTNIIPKWFGKQITLYQTTTRGYGNNKLPCIRIRP